MDSRPIDRLKQAAGNRLRPDRQAPAVPPRCGDIDIRIGRDGTWFYHGSPIARKPLVELFASMLRRDRDSHMLGVWRAGIQFPLGPATEAT